MGSREGIAPLAGMELPYVAFTEPCVYGLDEDGVCREVVPRTGASEQDIATANRCLGAQYVAALDGKADGFLTQLPKQGARLLFARTNDDGRIVLVRSSEVVRFWSRDKVEAEELEDRARRDAEPTARFSRKRMESGFQERVSSSRGVSLLELDDADLDMPTRRCPTADEEELDAATRRVPSTTRGFPPPAAVGT